MHAHERSQWSEAVAAQIRAELAASGLTQGDAAKAAGMSRATLNRLAQGSRVADVSQIHNLCGVFGLTVSEFIDRASRRLLGD